jgi:hypothetical protein
LGNSERRMIVAIEDDGLAGAFDRAHAPRDRTHDCGRNKGGKAPRDASDCLK